MVEVATLVALAAVAFAGGTLGAALGGLPAFSLAGLVIVVGEVAKVSAPAGSAVGDPAALGATGITAAVGLGPALGPHVAFGGGVAAAAYAARKGHLETDFEYHEAKHITYALGTRPDVLLVGGAFGVVGLLVARASAGLGLPWDPIAFAIVTSAFLHRLALGYPLVGDLRGDPFDMSPFERDERRSEVVEPVARTDDGRTDEDAADRVTSAHDAGAVDPEAGAVDPADRSSPGRYLVEPWLPHQYRWASVAVLGLVVGVFGAYVVHRTGSAFLAFGLTAASLFFLNLGMERCPVTHHMALPASVAVVGLAGAADPAVLSGGVVPAEFARTVALPVALAVGAGFGLVAALAGEASQRLLYAHADTHLDPPAAGIVVATLLIAVLDAVGFLRQTVVPVPGF